MTIISGLKDQALLQLFTDSVNQHFYMFTHTSRHLACSTVFRISFKPHLLDSTREDYCWVFYFSLNSILGLHMGERSLEKQHLKWRSLETGTKFV